ncbi:serine/threonine-protein kinase [Streptomyces boninensis]|uniref:serine/threonine-protein kinase n=1 Tax=Streptomyces boninensis TaxID=2039455 RepID=UPI003B213599
MHDQLLGGRYRLVRQLGEGGMGQVWEGQDESLGRPVAVKVISLLAGGGNRGDEMRARFLREARITARLQHPNIVTVHDHGETGTAESRVPFLVMELLQGEGLDAKLRRGAAALPDAARWGAQICDALADAHGAGVTHRDIKPSNVLITPSGNVKVLDFGIARAADPSATAGHLTQTGFIVGTPPYMAPEQARGAPEPRSDLYALGCLIFEMLTGRLPFQAPDTVGYLTAHLTQEPPAPSSVSAGISSAWDDLVLTLLHKDPDQRYPNATALAQALRQLDRTHIPEVSLQSTAAQPPPPRTLPMDRTRQQSRPDEPFTLSWTGEEPLDAYTSWKGNRGLTIGYTIAFAILLIGFLIMLVLAPGDPFRADHGESNWWVGTMSGFAILGAYCLIGLAGVGWLGLSTGNSPWSLQIGPPGIRTIKGTDRREYEWSQVQTFSTEEVLGEGGDRAAGGLHIKFMEGDDGNASSKSHPPGWPFFSGVPKRNGMVPVCVLGPMTNQQQTALREALARYGQGKADPWGE